MASRYLSSPTLEEGGQKNKTKDELKPSPKCLQPSARFGQVSWGSLLPGGVRRICRRGLPDLLPRLASNKLRLTPVQALSCSSHSAAYVHQQYNVIGVSVFSAMDTTRPGAARGGEKVEDHPMNS